MSVKILMVCMGNICRSPLAEGIMIDKINRYKLDALVDSAGTSNYHIGESPDVRSIANARKHGVEISHLRARQFTKSDFDDFDLILVMDTDNYNQVMRLATSKSHGAKVDFILNYVFVNENRSVSDPYYKDDNGFETVFELLEVACEHLALSLKKGIGKKRG